MAKKADLLKEIDKLNEKLAQRGHNKQKTSTFFLLLNSNEATTNATEVESSRQYMTSIVQSLGDNMDKVITFQNGEHGYSKEYVQDINIKFSLEQSAGRKKKDGTYSEYRGQVHAHVLVTVNHKSNVKMDYGKLQELLQPEFDHYYGHNGFVSKPKWIPDQMVEQYMTKSKEYTYGHKWKSV